MCLLFSSRITDPPPNSTNTFYLHMTDLKGWRGRKWHCLFMEHCMVLQSDNNIAVA